MGKQVTVLSGFTDVALPKIYTVPVSSAVAGTPAQTVQVLGVGGYNAGDTVTLTDAEYAALSAAVTRALGSPTTVAQPFRPSADPTSSKATVAATTSGTIALALGYNIVGPVTGATVLTLPAAGAGWTAGSRSTVSVKITQDATGSRAITHPTGVRWFGGSAPTATTTASKADYFEYFSDDGGVTVYGRVLGQSA